MAAARFGIFLLVASSGCASTHAANPDAGGAGGSAGSAGSGGSGGTGVTPGPSTLPTAPGPGDVPEPSGAPGNLKVLDWAGFKSAVSYTFDDAQPSQIEHYPELAAAGVPLTFYVTSGSSSSSASFDATFTQAVADGHEMGNHTVHHCHADLSGCSNGTATDINQELDDCSTYVAEHFGQSAVWTAASPFGDTGYNGPDASRFLLNRGVGSGTVGPNDSTDPFNLPCHAATEGEAVETFNSNIDVAQTNGRWLIFLIHTLAPTSQSWYAPIDVSVVTDSIAHAQSLGDVWIDTMVKVGAYWRAQNALSTVTPTTEGGSQTWTWTLPEHFPPSMYLRVTFDGGKPAQNGAPLTWDPHGYYELALDYGSVTLSP